MCRIRLPGFIVIICSSLVRFRKMKFWIISRTNMPMNSSAVWPTAAIEKLSPTESSTCMILSRIIISILDSRNPKRMPTIRLPK